MENSVRRYAPYILFAAMVLLFFAETLTLQAGFYSGDHRQQHYPWAFYLSEMLAKGQLPWWTSLFATGFPLLAEGQVGALYLPNLLFYKFLPFDVAYSYGILFHFFLAACFFYLFIREIGVERKAAVLGALIYLFGTAQGGYYYNIISLKTLIWFPLALFWIEKFFQRKRPGYLGLLAVTYVLQFTAGYLQYAVYSVFFSSLYFLVHSFRVSNDRKQVPASLGMFLAYAVAFGAAVLIAWPQLGATWELAKVSGRSHVPVDFAFVGSVNPLALWTLFFPHWDGLLKGELYVSSLGLFLLIHALLTKKSGREKLILALFIISLLLAFGKFNPLYYAFIKVSGFGSFRVPAKFLYFAGCFGAILCSFGMQKLPVTDPRRSWNLWVGLSAVAIVLLPLVHQGLLWFEGPIKDAGLEYIRHHYVGSLVHTQTLGFYAQKLNNVYAGLLGISRWEGSFNCIFIVFMLITFLVARRLIAERADWKWTHYAVIGGLIFLNLYAYGFTSVKGNLVPRSFLRPASPVMAALANVSPSERLHRYYPDLASSTDVLPVMPHNNMLYGTALVGGYSPLLVKDYFDLMAEVGDVNDSHRYAIPDRSVMGPQRLLLDFLAVRWLLSIGNPDLDQSSWNRVAEGPGHTLFRNSRAFPRAFYVPKGVSMSLEKFSDALKRGRVDFSKEVYLRDAVSSGTASEASFKEAVMIKDAGNRVELSLDAPDAGYLVISDLDYPGWQVTVNGTPAAIRKANGCFRAVRIPGKGAYTVDFRYLPVWRRVLPFSLVFFFCVLAVSLYNVAKNKAVPEEDKVSF